MPAEPIAIIGTGCRFPGECSSPSKLWELLKNPRDVQKEIPDFRFSVDAFYHPNHAHHGTSNVRHSYLLDEDLRRFDANFFGIKPIEASAVDPQQRLLLETVYEGLEAAGLSMKQLQGSDTAVYVGVMSADFTDMIGRDTESFPTYFATGTARSILSNRISYMFDWHGASMTIDTACSSSLIAMHQAVQTLRSGESSVAVVAGSNIILGPEQFVAESKLQMLSPTGRSRMWDSRADGYARGEGVAALILKPLSKAVADGDHIECVIRETGTNQDGKTSGITMPSATAQATLIQSTYARAGLDLNKRSDRPQFFEAHGTGTPAGDPVEAKAIHSAFFGTKTKHDPLYIGGIKTVVGHTEGTAGVAAVIKASLALQSSTIPPNLLLERLNPAIEPLSKELRILSKAQPWPKTEGGVRRASVNSFGFGGSNAHAILESYEPEHSTARSAHGDISFIPFVFSAASDVALFSTLRSYRDYLQGETGVDSRDLSWTLANRRSHMSSRVALPGSTIDNLLISLDDILEKGSVDSISPSKSGPILRILGVFTGQGAQWPRMGANLLEKSAAANRIVDNLDRRLQTLPPKDRPTWSLHQQLRAPAKSSQVNTAEISQPLCTAVQILMVDLLRHAGIEFSAVVGHSSGEIGAAYAAGYLTADDAICIAYYRGLHLRVVDQKGAMLAVGTSYEDAKELCDLPSFDKRVCVAASNSATSVTLSGDADAIDEIKIVFEEEKRFTRLLKVDRAYHSHHMYACSQPYTRALRLCKIKPLSGHLGCRWVSSVFAQDISQVPESLADSYWASNLTRPVKFFEAVEQMLSEHGPFDLAIEVGPHPALKGPVSQTIQEQHGDLPYTGVLSRGNDDVASFLTALGFIWASFRETVVDFSKVNTFLSDHNASTPKLIKNLPSYSWDRSQGYWHESRLSKAFRTRTDLPHELLGRQILDGVTDQRRWRNFLRPSEIDWLDGHRVEGQMVFPAAGYVSACIEAILRVAGGQEVRSVDLTDFVVGQAVVFKDDNASVETLIALTNIVFEGDSISANFSFHSSPNSESLDLINCSSSRVRAVLGEAIIDVLPPKPDDDFQLREVETDRFYDSLSKLGFGYSGSFHALTDIKRKLGMASGFIENAARDGDCPLLIHPATLDCAIQSIMLAYCYPGDSMLRRIYLPTGFDKLTVNPLQCMKFSGKHTFAPFDSAANTGTGRSLEGDASIYSPDGGKAIQLEGLHTQPLVVPTASDDLNIFTELTWGVDRPDCEEILSQDNARELNGDLLFSLERVAYYYLRTLGETTPPRAIDEMEWHHKRLFAYVDHVVSKAKRGTARFVRKEWMRDTEQDILEIINQYPENIDLRLMSAVGKNLPAVIAGNMTMLEPMIEDNKLNDFYVIAHGMPLYTQYLASIASQISHRYPHMSVLEIGAGTGGATKSFLKELGDRFSTYTYTDISSGFFEKAGEVFAAYESRMNFKVLDVEKDITEQGFEAGSFDLIIASLVLHATRNMEQTMRNVRNLLKPGGYLLLLEITENEQMRFGLIFGGLAGWWLGYDDGREFSPCIELDEWSNLLEKTGFSGMETMVPHHETLPVPLSIIVSRAVDDRLELLEHPLQSQETNTIAKLNIITDGGANSARVSKAISKLLSAYCTDISAFESLSAVRADELTVGSTTLCLSDLDEPVFKSMTADKLSGFQDIFRQSKNILWVTQGAKSGDPYARMVVGFGRTVVLEMTHLRLQFLDFSQSASPNAEVITASLLRLELSGSWEDSATNAPILHSVEPELFFDNGKYFVPRFKLNKEQNTRYNSNGRAITSDVSVEKCNLRISHEHENTVALQEFSRPLDDAIPNKSVKDVLLKVAYSISRAIEVCTGTFLIPVLGVDKQTGEQVLALAAEAASEISVSRSFIIPKPPSVSAQDSLQLFYLELLANAALRCVPNGGSAMVLEPSRDMAATLKSIAEERDINLEIITAQPENNISGWQYVHAGSPRKTISALVNKDTSGLLVLGYQKDVETRLVECLPRFAKILTLDTLSSLVPKCASSAAQDVRSLLLEVRHSLGSRGRPVSRDLPSIHLADFIKLPSFRDPHLISWVDDSHVPVEIEAIESHVRFQGDRSYWLVGLTGGLGQSLCEWMYGQGARYIIISSRNPKVDDRWLEKMKAQGLSVEVVANDVTSRDSVQAVYRHICRTQPPIAGVAQGAMVLHDTMFSELDMERLEKVIKPKVNGASHLEEIFHDVNLDFFVFFSSMASITGNPGQSAYAAANMFMAALAAERRKRGLNASAVHIGAIFGNGYVTRELTLAQQEFLRKVGNLWLSEHDFRRLFAEAIFAGRHERGRSAELSTGLKTVDKSEAGTITWFNNPMFQHCVKENISSQTISSAGSGASLKAMLLEAESPAQVRQCLQDAFVSKLRTSLQFEDDRSILDLAAETLGIDSLVAVDIRSWFIKEVNVEIPVLKILSGATVIELLVEAQEPLAPELIPKMDPNSTAKPASQQDSRRPQPTRESFQQTHPAPKGRSEAESPQAVPTVSAAVPVVELHPSSRRTRLFTKPNEFEPSSVDTARSASPITRSVSTSLSTDDSNNAVEAQLDSPHTTSWSEIDDDEKLSLSGTFTGYSDAEDGSRGLKKHSSAERGRYREADQVASIDSSLENLQSDHSDSRVAKQLALGFGQSRFWFLTQYLEDPSSLNITVSIKLEGALVVDKLSRAFETVGQRHQALRTRFRTNENGSPVQEILEDSLLHLEYRAITNESEADAAYEELAHYRYNLDKGETMRAVLLKLPNQSGQHKDRPVRSSEISSPLHNPTSDSAIEKGSRGSTKHFSVEESCYGEADQVRSSNSRSHHINHFADFNAGLQLILGYHHINMDGVSLEVVLRDLQLAYDGKTSSARILQYSDFAEKQRQEYDTGSWKKDLDFWKADLGDTTSPPLPLLPMAKLPTRPVLTAHATNSADFYVEPALQQSIEACCRKTKTTPFNFHLALFYTMLIRLVDVEDIFIGISSQNRKGVDMQQSVGPYLNLLPLRLKTQPSDTFTKVLQMVQGKSTKAFAHSKVPFELIIKELGVSRATTHSPIFQVLVNYRAGVSEDRPFCGCKSKLVRMEQGQAPYDLSLDIIDNSGGDCHVIVAGQSALYDSEAVSLLKDIYHRLLRSFARNPATRLQTPTIYSEDQVKHAIKAGIGPFVEYNWPETIPHRIETMAKRYASRVALRDGRGTDLSYSGMMERANSIAIALQGCGIGHGSKVGVFMLPGSDWICSLLAIFLLDATYVALDARAGLERLSRIVADCRADLILSDNTFENEITSLEFEGQSVNVSQLKATTSGRIQVAAKPSSVAVLAYTSGSTGVPKSIIMKHHHFRNNLEIATQKWHFRQAEEITLQQSSYGFDMSLCQIFLTLANAGTLCIVPADARGDPNAIADLIAKEKITTTIATPSEYVSWFRYGSRDVLRNSAWRVAVSGGEAVNSTMISNFNQLQRPGMVLCDCYGPTEITFCSNSRELDISNSSAGDMSETAGLETWPSYSVQIVDHHMQPVAPGVTGEVVIGGAAVTSGYSNREINSRGFARNTWAPPFFVDHGWTTLHRTGDIGRMSSDGRLTLSGRIAGDTQAKLRGMRIDLQEIEAAIHTVADGMISDVAVIMRTSPNTEANTLVAFFTQASHVDLKNVLQEMMSELPLPQYMRPATVVTLAEMPRTSSGKIDRMTLQTLPLPEELRSDQRDSDLQGNALKMKLVWTKVISEEFISRHTIALDSDFFHVGGDSMSVVAVQAEIQRVFGITLSLIQLFESSTLGSMTLLVDRSPGKAVVQDEAVGSVDWEAETAIPHHFSTPVPEAKRFFAYPETIILTGATGFLGRVILSRLLTDCSVRTIHCLAVRKNKRDLPDIFQSSKVIIHSGDLTQAHFGLDEQLLHQLFASVDAVIHNAADVSFLKSYHSLKPANLEATKELVRLSLPHRLSFHYISTASVTHLTGLDTYDQRSVSKYLPSLDEGYIATKWASERFLEKVCGEYELPIWIHRPSSISGEQAAVTDMMSNLLRYSLTLRAIPTMGPWRGQLDFISADRVAMEIADEVYSDMSWPGTVRYLYQSGEREIPLSDLKAVLEQEAQATFTELPLDDWIARAQDAGLNLLLGDYLRAASAVPIVFPKLMKQGGLME